VYLARLFAAGAVGGVIAAGAGGRPVMRLLAATSPASEGMLTEAQARIGEITVGGTIGFLIFADVPAGRLCVALFMVAGPVLPRTRRGGVMLGLALLVLAGSLIDPLRSDNFDFALVGPDWLSVTCFAALAVFQGLVVHALAIRAGRPRARPRIPAIRAAALAVATLVAVPSFALAVGGILTCA
jgi:hypothetical protein